MSDTETIKMLSSAAVEAIMGNRATAIGRIGEFSVAALCKDVRDGIHAVAKVEAKHNDVSIDLYQSWSVALTQFGSLVRGA